MDAWRELANLLVPSGCVLCARSGWSLCDLCRSSLSLRLEAVERHGLCGFRLTSYQPEVASTIDQFKEHGVTEVAYRWLDGCDFETLTNQFKFDCVVPIPSSPKANRVRGYAPANELAKALRTNLRLQSQWPPGAQVLSALSRTPDTLDQAGLSIAMRWRNLEGKFLATKALAGRRILLVDDIVTTGATLLEAARAIEVAGGQAIGFFCFAETELRKQTDFS